MLKRTITLTAKNKDYKEINRLADDDRYFVYQDQMIHDEKDVPSHIVIEKAIATFGEDYRAVDSQHPVSALRSRKSDNTTIARKKD